MVKFILAYLPLHLSILQRMSRVTRTKPTNALSSSISCTSISGGWTQSNQDLDSSASEINNKLGDSDDHLKVMMQTRVAVRDKTPHRFQVVPLCDVTNLSLTRTEVSDSNILNVPTPPMITLPSGKLAPYSQTRANSQSASPIRSLNSTSEEIWKLVAGEEDSHLSSQVTEQNTKARSANYSRKVLAELDSNRMVKTKFVSKPVAGKSVPMSLFPSRTLLTPFTRAETSIIQTTPRASTGGQPRQNGMHQPPTILGAHISEISQLFSSENVVPLSTVRRNRSMTVTSIRSDSSFGISDTLQETEAKLKRRHAIYRESSCTPYYSGKSYFDALDDNVFLATHRDLAENNKNRINFDQNASALETSSRPLYYSLESKQGNTTLLAGRPWISHLPNSGAGGLIPVRALKLSENKHVTRPTNTGDTVYSQIILELFRDIDEAIAQWGQA